MIIGTVCLHDIRFAAYSCTEIGYKFDAAFRRMGYASEAIKKVMSLAFYDLHLHRVFARVMPENKPSIYLLESLGFQYEGVERGCFFIQNRWADHLRYAYLNLPPTINSCIFYAQPLSKTSPFCQTVILQKNDTSSQTGFQPAPA